MSVDQEDISQYLPKPNAYGKIIRERGTQRILVLAAVLAAAWLLYGNISDRILSSKQWPPLSADSKGLTVLGLLPDKYKAYEVNHAWQIRRPQEDLVEQDSEGPSKEEMPELQDRGSNPGAGRGERGKLVPLEEIMQ